MKKPYALGIDLHKRESVWVLLDGEYNEVWKASVRSRPEEYSKMVEKLPVKAEEIRVALEPVCGWRWVSALLTEAGMAVKIAHPYKVRLIAESTQKHDLGDARMLASLLIAGYFPEARRCSDETYSLRLLLRERDFLVAMRTRAMNRLHGIATATGYSENPLHKKRQAEAMAHLPAVTRELFSFIEELTKRIKPFDAHLRKRAKEEPLVPLLMTVPGIGPLTALTIVAEVESFERFPTPGHLASYAGIIPRQRSSGKSVRLGSITNQGSARLRTAMVEAAMRIRPQHDELYAFYARLSPRCGQVRELLGILVVATRSEQVGWRPTWTS